MRRVLRSPFAVVTALLCLGRVDAHAQASEIDFSKIKWRSLSPPDSMARFAILHVDSISGATQMVYRLPPNTTSPCHWHTASQGTVVQQGSETVWHAGTDKGSALGVGGFSFVPARTPFRLRTGPTETIVFASMDGKFDINIVPEEQCRSAPTRAPRVARAFEIEFTKVEWTHFPTKDSPVLISILHVDSTSGTTHMLFQLPPNDTSPCHWHTASESNVIVKGSAGMRHTGMTERASLSVGGFSFVPKRMGHQISTGSTTTLVFSSLDARFDFHPVEEAQCR